VSLWRSLRVRLTVAFLVLATATVAVAATVTVLLVEQATLGTLDAVLLEEATTLAALVDLPSDRLGGAVRDIGRETDMGPGKFVVVRGADGSVVAASRAVPPGVVTRGPAGRRAAFVATVGEDEAMFRVAWAPAPDGATVAIGIHASGAIRTVQRTRWAVAVAGLLLLAILAAGAWTITGRATRALDQLTDEVSTIQAGSLARRLSTRGTDEVDRLVHVLNRVLERLQASVEQLRRFTADAAHELRTPLAAVRARLEVALAEDAPTVPREQVADALEQAERLGRLAEDLLMLARVEGGTVATSVLDGVVDLAALVQEVGEALSPLAEEQRRPFRWTTDAPLAVRGSEPLLKRVVLNLVDNAFRHTPAEAAVDIVARRDGTHAIVDVGDAGPGIDPTLLPHVFDRFRSGGPGAGLGLALVREIVARHGGTVAIVAGRDGGTAARVRLPLECRPGQR